jgi:hypothetical protein
MSKLIIESGMKFNSWTILEELEPKIHTTSKGRKIKIRLVKCRCDCGVEKIVRLGNIRNGASSNCKQCCIAKRRNAVRAGEKYNKWTVLKEISPLYKGSVSVQAQCDCGHIAEMTLSSLTKARSSKSCVNCANKARRMDLTGQKIGFLTVIERIAGKYLKWKCLCVCGEKLTMSQQTLTRRRRNPRHCGCKGYPAGQKHQSWKGYGQISSSYWSRIIKNARKRGIAFELKIEDTWELFLKQEARCALTGDEIYFAERTTEDQTASIDRINNTQPYTLDNVQWVHKHVNSMKLDHNQEYFIELCKKIAVYNS